VFIYILNVEVRDTRNFYFNVILQNITYIVKKISRIYLENRINSNLQYDDITFFYISIVAIEFVFIFDHLLVQDNPIFQQTISAVNFIIIQIQNITNKSIFYLVYEYFRTKAMVRLKRMVVLKYCLIVFVTVYDYMYQFVNGLLIFAAYKVYMKYVQRFLSKDSELGQRR